MLCDLMININKLYELLDSTDFSQFDVLDILTVIAENNGKIILNGEEWDFTR